MSGRYSVYQIDLSGPKPIFIPSFDFIDVLETSGDFDLSKVQLSIEGGDPIPLDRLPIKLPTKSKYALVTWDDSITSGTLKLILGRDLFQLMRVNTARIESINTSILDKVEHNWKPDLEIFDVTVDTIWNVAGNMLYSVKDLTVTGTLIVSDQALFRTWGNVTVDGGKVIITDNAQIISEVV